MTEKATMDVIMPQLGETVLEGIVATWYKKVGDEVKADEPLFEVETDKVTTEIPAPASGVVKEILVEPGVTVKVGTKLAVIETAAEAGAAATLADTRAATASTSAGAAPAARVPGGPKLSPVVRRLIAEHGLDPQAIEGSGADGRITREDVLAYLERRKTAAAPVEAVAKAQESAIPQPAPRSAVVQPTGQSAVARPAPQGAIAQSAPAPQKAAEAPPQGAKAPVVEPGKDDTVVPMNKIRRLTAAHMVRSVATSPHTLQAVEVDFSAVERARAARGAAWKAKEGFSLTYLPFVARAVCEAIARFPHVNASVGEDCLIVHNRIHLGVAVDLNFDGLVVPVVRDAQNKTLRALALEIHDLAGRARRGLLKPDELSGGTYTISNSGPFGTLITAPIINQPQVAILSTDGVRKKPVAVEGPEGDAIAIRPVGVIAQTFDHRAFDGAYSAAFLRQLKEILETRDWLAELP